MMADLVGYLSFGMTYWIAEEFGFVAAGSFFVIGIFLCHALWVKKRGPFGPRLF